MSSAADNFYKAVATVIVAIFLFDVQAAIIKQMGGRYPVEQITLYRNFLGAIPYVIVLVFAARRQDHQRSLLIKRWPLAVGRGVLLIFAQMSFYTSLIYMELATATTLGFAGPLFVTMLSVPLLGHRVGWVRSMAVVLGFCGVVMVMQPGRDAFSMVALLPVTAAFFYALASISARFFDENESTALISLYASVGAVSASLLLVLFNGSPIMLSSTSDWWWFLAMGGVGGSAVLLFISAYRMTEPSNLSPFEYFGIPFSFLLGWWLFEETPFDSLVPGVFFIVGAGLLVVWRERALKRQGA